MTVLPLVLAAVAMFPIWLEHANTPTSLPLVEVAPVLRVAHVEVFGWPPSRDRLRIAVGQVRLEGLNLGGKNLGGLEYVEGLPWVRLDRLTRLRAFDSYEAAARAYWTLLGSICKGALMAMDAGDPAWTARALKRCRYFGVSVERHEAGLRRLSQ